MEKTTLSARSRRLLTLSAIYTATTALLPNITPENFQDSSVLAISFWDEVAKQIPEWELAKKGDITSGDVRRDFIHSHAVVLQAIGNVGYTLINNGSAKWKQNLKKMKTIDWSRSNSKLWEGRAMIGGRVSNSQHNVILTTNAIKNHMKIELSPEEQRVEDAFLRGDYDKK